ncbi:MAG: hypothetical protein EZS28_039618, partial [Streblomastix strix]
MNEISSGVGTVIFGTGISGIYGTISGFVKTNEAVLIEKSLINQAEMPLIRKQLNQNGIEVIYTDCSDQQKIVYWNSDISGFNIKLNPTGVDMIIHTFDNIFNDLSKLNENKLAQLHNEHQNNINNDKQILHGDVINELSQANIKNNDIIGSCVSCSDINDVHILQKVKLESDLNNNEQEVEQDQISEGLIEVFAGLNPTDSVIKDLEQILVELQSRKQIQRQNEQIMKQKENQQKPPIPLLGIKMPTQMQYDADQCMSERSLQSFD